MNADGLTEGHQIVLPDSNRRPMKPPFANRTAIKAAVTPKASARSSTNRPSAPSLGSRSTKGMERPSGAPRRRNGNSSALAYFGSTRASRSAGTRNAPMNSSARHSTQSIGAPGLAMAGANEVRAGDHRRFARQHAVSVAPALQEQRGYGSDGRSRQFRYLRADGFSTS